MTLTQRVDQVLSVFALQRDDFTARSADIGVDIECLPQVIDGRRAGHGTHIEQNADVGLQDGAERVEEPAVRIDLLLILLLQAENDLHGDHAAVSAFDLHGRGDRDLDRIFVNVRRHGFAVDNVLQGN